MKAIKHNRAHSYNCKLDYTLHEPRYSHRPVQTHLSRSSNLKISSRSPSPVKLSNFTQPSLPTIQETAHLPHSKVQLDKLFRILNERPSSRYDSRDPEMEYFIKDIDSVIKSCNTVAGRHRKPKRPIALPQLPLRKYLTCANTTLSRNQSYRNPSPIRNSCRSNLTKQNSLNKLQYSHVKKHVRSSSFLAPAQYSQRAKYTRSRKASSTSLVRDTGYIKELEKMSNLKDIPTNLHSSYLSNASLYKSIILVIPIQNRSSSSRSRNETPNESRANTPKIGTPNKSFSKTGKQRLSGDKVILKRISSLLKKIKDKERSLIN